MRVHSLALTNIKRHKGTFVLDPLPSGVVLFLGRNGRGKTTVPQALSLAVFGSRPEAFRARAGTGLVGFVNRQCTAGRIRAVVEFAPDRVFTLDVTLKVGDRTKSSGEPSNEFSYDIYEGKRSLTDDLPRNEALHRGIKMKDYQAFAGEQLELPVSAETLCDNLLSPPQTGGLTAFFDLKPGERVLRTEKMLALQDVRKVGKQLASMCRRIETGAKRLAEQFGEALANAEARVLELAPLRAAHQRMAQPYDALSIGELRVAFNPARGRTVGTVGQRLVAYDSASKARAAAHSRWVAISELGAQLDTVVQACTRLGQTKEQLLLSQAAEVRAQALAPQAQQWAAANENFTRQVTRDRERAGKRTAIQQRQVAAQTVVNGADEREEVRSAERQNIVAQRVTLEAELAALDAQMSDWDARSDTAAKTKASEAECQADIRVLKDLYTAVAGVGDIDDPEDKLAQVREAVSAQRLPDRASNLLAVVSAQIQAAARGEQEADGEGWTAEIDVWLRGAGMRVEAATQACFTLQQESGRATQKRENAMRSQAQWSAREAALLAERESDLIEVTEAKQALEALRLEAAEMEAEYQTVDTELASAKALREDPSLKAAHEEWIVQSREAGHKEARSEAYTTQLQSTQGVVDALTLEEDKPVLDDLAGWTALRVAVQAQSATAQQQVQQAGHAVTSAQQAHNESMGRLRALNELERGLVESLEVLAKDRAQVRELRAFHDLVVQRLPGALASRVIEQVSTSANEYFSQVFQQPSEPMQLRWDPSNYTVYVDRESGTIPARHCSGGEKMALGIALNLAILHFMAPDVRWLVLDEPTAGLDKENRSGLRDFVSMLREPGAGHGTLFDQLLFISHESELFEGMSDTFVFDDDGVHAT